MTDPVATTAATVTKILRSGLDAPSTGSTRKILNRWTESLATKMTEAETWDSATRVCELTCEVARLEEMKKASAKDFADKIKKASEAREKEARAVVTGMADREVEIEEVYDLVDDLVLRIRVDTGKTIAKRRATEAERQQSVEFGE